MRPRASIPARPTALGRYEVIGKIASGGMASIYLGRAGAGEVVALKVMRNDVGDDDDGNMDHMFLDEANILTRLDHPNIVKTLETGVANGQKFIAMELLVGRTLQNVYDTCDERRLGIPPEIVAWIGARVASALHHAHELADDAGKPLGIIHRDVNPSNVFLTFTGDVKLFDFGMAKFRTRHAKSSPGIVKGKLPYLAPEQIMQLALDHRADVFGLGTTLWEMLTMRRLFHRPSPVETVKAVHVGPIPDVRTIIPELSARVSDAVMRSLQRNREHRYGTMAELERDLDAFVGNKRGAIPSQIGSMLDSLFPHERKRQLGWLKPVITAGGVPSRPPPSVRVPSMTPPPVNVTPSVPPAALGKSVSVKPPPPLPSLPSRPPPPRPGNKRD
ncbi:serine/threonine protein kinase [Labilithrix luteola]|uniref:Serine/threonine protein kinase n=1 Tax=Labilithrix luteola TaxID=1391654 RepID=A0A0K1Q0N0_9BACT|nr:serine/threonine protein kinase [Labilithrix luteola]